MPRTTIASTAADLLAEHRALAPEELGQLIAARGLTRSKQPARAVSRALDVDRRFRRLSDGRWAVPAQLLRGATLTHRVTAGEAATDVLALTPDLTPLVALASCGTRTPPMRAAPTSTSTSRSRGRPAGWPAARRDTSSTCV
jgi:hypothetical protein